MSSKKQVLRKTGAGHISSKYHNNHVSSASPLTRTRQALSEEGGQTRDPSGQKRKLDGDVFFSALIHASVNIFVAVVAVLVYLNFMLLRPYLTPLMWAVLASIALKDIQIRVRGFFRKSTSLMEHQVTIATPSPGQRRTRKPKRSSVTLITARSDTPSLPSLPAVIATAPVLFFYRWLRGSVGELHALVLNMYSTPPDPVQICMNSVHKRSTRMRQELKRANAIPVNPTGIEGVTRASDGFFQWLFLMVVTYIAYRMLVLAWASVLIVLISGASLVGLGVVFRYSTFVVSRLGNYIDRQFQVTSRANAFLGRVDMASNGRVLSYWALSGLLVNQSGVEIRMWVQTNVNELSAVIVIALCLSMVSVFGLFLGFQCIQEMRAIIDMGYDYLGDSEIWQLEAFLPHNSSSVVQSQAVELVQLVEAQWFGTSGLTFNETLEIANNVFGHLPWLPLRDGPSSTGPNNMAQQITSHLPEHFNASTHLIQLVAQSDWSSVMDVNLITDVWLEVKHNGSSLLDPLWAEGGQLAPFSTRLVEYFSSIFQGTGHVLAVTLFSMTEVIISTVAIAFEVSLNSFVFLTSLYYLLASELDIITHLLKPFPFNEGLRAKVKHGLNDAINKTFKSTMKLCAYHALFTWLTYEAAGVRFVYLCTVGGGLLAMLPFFPPWIISIPGAVQLMAVNRTYTSFSLIAAHVAVWWFVDTAIYAETLHPYITGLSIVLGLYAFGAQGVLIGPLLVCVAVLTYKVAPEISSMPAAARDALTPIKKRWDNWDNFNNDPGDMSSDFNDDDEDGGDGKSDDKDGGAKSMAKTPPGTCAIPGASRVGAGSLMQTKHISSPLVPPR